MFDLWRRLREEWGYWRAKKLYRRAFFLADHLDYLGAARLLEEATTLSPDDPEVWNELAYCSGKLGNAAAGEQAARRAIELEPRNPKYRNSLVGIQLDECWKQTSRAGLDSLVAKVSPDVIAMQRLEDYPAGILAKALLLALQGMPEPVWQAVLQEAQAAYLRRDGDAARATAIVAEQRLKCENAAKLVDVLTNTDRARRSQS